MSDPGTYIYKNTYSKAVTLDWSLRCLTSGCTRDTETGTETLLPGQSQERGWGHICLQWRLTLTVGGCVAERYTAQPVNCPTPTPQLLPWGVRDPKVDLYTVTVLDVPPPEITSIFDQYSTKYYNSATADKLSEILQMIFSEIVSRMTTFEIKRVVPTPVQ